MTNRALLVVDMQNGFCHPEGVLTSYELAKIARVGEGYDLGHDDRTPIRA